LRNAIRLSRDPALGLEMGSKRHISTLDRFGFAMMCCETFREALRVGFEYQRVVGRFSGRLLFLSAHEEADTAVIQIEVAPELGDLSRFAVEEILGSILASTLDHRHELPLRNCAARIQHRRMPAPTANISTCPIRFDAPDQQLRFDAGFLDTPLPLASSHAARIYRQHCRALIKRDAQEHDEARCPDPRAHREGRRQGHAAGRMRSVTVAQRAHTSPQAPGAGLVLPADHR
ncbi:MAG: AraC family transcriptional regulator ligand-binding domain-containing protein, partial [Gammaproteobacteria bacterium]|nr:AraC family transcriptional regulator ligand-binding domain-containing protein [Gammaproteobacteria bacterium]